jgi:ABC-type Fe3+-citrate transport system substrate-binding protein
MSIIKKTTAVAMIAVAALAVSACGKTENTNITENTTVTDMNTMAPEEGTMNDMGNEAGNSSNMM